jgi:hypothetical protein
LRRSSTVFLVSFTGVAICAGSFPALSESSSATSPCAVTVPTRKGGGGFGPGGFNHGNARLRVQLSWQRGLLRAGILPDGGSMATINRDGSIRTKLGWWVRDAAKLTVVGKRLDRPAPRLRASVPSGYGVSLGFQPTALTFPTVGCWRVIGQAGTASLTFLVEVTKLR